MSAKVQFVVPLAATEVGRAEINGKVGAQTARGVFWTLLYSTLNKLVAMAAQFGIAWYLSPQDIGLVATATSVVGILSLLMGGQLQRVLIQRQRSFAEDAGQVFWISMCLNVVVACLIAASASKISQAFGDAKLKELLWIIAAAIPMMTFPVAYGARLLIDMRFGLMSALSFGEGAIRNLGGVMLAASGFGPRSLVIPLIFSGLFASLAQRKAAGKIAFGCPRPAQWKKLLAPASWLMLVASLTSGIGYGTNLIIAAFHPLEVTGFYFWGFSMSSQTVFLLVTNLQGVLFPAFAKMGAGAVRQRQAFEHTIAILALVVVPVTCLQILLAQPVVSLLFHPRWAPAVIVIQWLSVGILTQPLNVMGGALLMARGEYRKMAGVTAIMAVLTFIAALAGSHLGQEREIAKWVGITALLINILPGLTAYQLLGGNARELWATVALPVVFGVPAACIGFVLNEVFGNVHPLLRIISVSAAVLLTYSGLVARFCPDLTCKVRSRLKELRRTA